MTEAEQAAFAALDIADRLIERAYGTDVPQEWKDAYACVAAIRANPTPVDGAGEPVSLPSGAIAKGAGRDSEMPRALILYLDRAPSDDDLRLAHDLFCGRPIHAAPSPRSDPGREALGIMRQFLVSYASFTPDTVMVPLTLSMGDLRTVCRALSNPTPTPADQSHKAEEKQP